MPNPHLTPLSHRMRPVAAICSSSLVLLGIQQCPQGTDQDGDDWTVEQGDCDDQNAAIYPGAPERWDDCLDFDCDGLDFTAGDGRPGGLSVPDAQFQSLVLSSGRLTTSASPGDTSLVVDSSPVAQSGEVVLVRVAASADVNQVGVYELLQVSEVSGNTIHLRLGLVHGYSSADTVLVTALPQFQNVSLGNGAFLTGVPWDGISGGNLAALVQGTVSVPFDAFMSTSGGGYRGGARSYNAQEVGQQGESQMGMGSNTFSANLTGGGGGSAPSYAHASGGGGGYGTAGGTGGNYPGYSTTPGEGGASWGDPQLTPLHFGGAGGAGGLDADPGAGAYGGAGGHSGGIVLFVSGSLDLQGTIVADGSRGEDGQISGGASPGGGGGGAGGSILISSRQLVSKSGRVQALGGSGGIGSEAGYAITYGGQGGTGRIRLELPISVASSPEPAVFCESPGS